MTEEEWLTTIHPMPMLEFLQPKASERKFRLFAISCCRHKSLWRLLGSESRALVDAASRYVEGAVRWDEVAVAAIQAPRGIPIGGGRVRGHLPVHLVPSSQAERAALGVSLPDAWDAAWEVFRQGANLLDSVPCEMLRELVRNPYHPITLDPSWRTPTVVSLAQAIYDDRQLPSGLFDNQRMGVLADALEEAGCDNADVLDHCRKPGEHVRGCWVIDHLLGKE